MSENENNQQASKHTLLPAQAVSLLVLAGGMGSRFGGDKQLATLGDTQRTLLHFSVLDAYRAGVRELVLIVREALIPAFEASVLPHFPADLQVKFVVQQLSDVPNSACYDAQRQKPWGTAHAVWAARQQLTQPFIVINADDYYGAQAMQLLVQHFQQSTDWAMVAYPLSATLSEHGGVNRGCCRVQQQRLCGVEEWTEIQQAAGQLTGLAPTGMRQQIDPQQLVSMNIWGFTPAIMLRLDETLQRFFQHDPGLKGECYLPSVVNEAIAVQPLQVYASSEQWYGMTYANDLPQLTHIFEQKLPAYQE